MFQVAARDEAGCANNFLPRVPFHSSPTPYSYHQQAYYQQYGDTPQRPTASQPALFRPHYVDHRQQCFSTTYLPLYPLFYADMRFLNTSTLQFEEVADSSLGVEQNKYAILSHRWGPARDEISFADIDEGREISHKKGFAKLKGFCDLTASLGYRYGWDDTCCINKGDGSELAEAINSMYRWYRGSSVCIVYLEDVPEKPMMDSRWFDRGWTLQELIAPEVAIFYNRDWSQIGTKNHLLAELCSKTGIPEDVLSHVIGPSKCSIAQRMSWAAKRETTRVEDRAYSLLGIFDVSMPSIYGEREKAFLRLQRLISQQTKDESIFAWSMGLGKHEDTYSGLFAPSPSSYIHCSDMISTRGSTGYAETNGELSITLKTSPHSMETFYAILNCTRWTRPDSRVAILLTRLSTENEYLRANKGLTGGIILVAPSDFNKFADRPVRIALEPTELPPNDFYGFWLRTLEPPGRNDCEARILSRSEGSEADEVCLGEMQYGTAGIVYFEPNNSLSRKFGMIDDEPGWSRIRWIKLGFDRDFNPVLLIANDSSLMLNMEHRPMRLQPNEHLFRQTISSEAGPQALAEIFDNRWISSEAPVPSRLYGWYRGVSILKVDRRKGISGCLEALNLGISVKLCPARICNQPSREKVVEQSKQIWVVDITDTNGNDPERDLIKAAKKRTRESCIGCLCIPNDSEQMESQKYAARSLRKVMGASDLGRLK